MPRAFKTAKPSLQAKPPLHRAYIPPTVKGEPSANRTRRIFAFLIALVTCVSIFEACKTEPTTDPNETKYNEAFDQSEAGDYAR